MVHYPRGQGEHDPVLDLLENQEFSVKKHDVSLNGTAMVSTCNISKREEYGKSNLAAAGVAHRLLWFWRCVRLVESRRSGGQHRAPQPKVLSGSIDGR